MSDGEKKIKLQVSLITTYFWCSGSKSVEDVTLFSRGTGAMLLLC